MPDLQQGMPAPDFDLPTDTGERFRLSAHAGKAVLLYFYPQADTPACTDENIAFTTHKDAFAEKDILLVGISPDTPKQLAAFREKYGLSPILVSDPDHTAIEAYGVWGEKKNYGRTYMGLIRTTVLVGADGKIAQIWPNIRAKGHVERVLKALA
ncbi:peroxiredoxin [Pelagibacterium xiamenense]|uniref:peroxiredoxin n=1 Tax=Pelagibacterium xiamenense TaxID=2901140 RepID=UPI001E63D44C|nr:peroxiredoxin [Pelagibacterium xiamenense]MCD7061104.1 peroxiredoxin [Pelagibacterium xiamenense]